MERRNQGRGRYVFAAADDDGQDVFAHLRIPMAAPGEGTMTDISELQWWRRECECECEQFGGIALLGSQLCPTRALK